jgi:hypothetical protein
MAALFPLPLLGLASAATAALVTQAQGWRVALADCSIALGLLLALTLVTGGEWLAIGLGAALTWLVSVGLGALRRSAALTLAVQVAVLTGLAGVTAFALMVKDEQGYWAAVIREFAERATAAGMDLGPVESLLGLAGLMTGVVAASAVLTAVVALVLGSWWASQLGAGDVVPEFQALRMGRVIGALALLAVALSLTGWRSTADDLGLVLGAGFALQGLAVAHWQAAHRRWPRWWSLVLYGPMLLLPALAGAALLLLAVVGVVDNGWSLRRRAPNVV